MSLLINEAKSGGLSFSLDQDNSSIVVEVPTRNQPIYYGAGDISDPKEKVSQVIAKSDSIIIEFADGNVRCAPLRISGKNEARIYQYGESEYAWLWKKHDNGEVIIEPEKRL